MNLHFNLCTPSIEAESFQVAKVYDNHRHVKLLSINSRTLEQKAELSRVQW